VALGGEKKEKKKNRFSVETEAVYLIETFYMT
jgi:hypothetical protein